MKLSGHNTIARRLQVAEGYIDVGGLGCKQFALQVIQLQSEIPQPASIGSLVH